MENQPLPFQTEAPSSTPPSSPSTPAPSAPPAPPTQPSERSRTRKLKLPKPWPYFLAGLGGILLIAWLLRPTPIAVDLATVERGPLQVTLAAEGKTRVRDRYVVSAPVAGRLARIDLDTGDTVEKDTLVAQLDPLPYDSEVRSAQGRLQQLQAELAGVETQRPKTAALDQAQASIQSAQADRQAAQAQVTQAQADLAQASRDRARSQSLFTAGAISRQQLETDQLTETRRQQELQAAQERLEGAIADAQAAADALTVLQAERSDPDYLLDAYRAQIMGVEAELANLADQAQRTNIVAPAAGKVLRLYQESADFVQAGAPLVEVGDPTDSELVIDILSTDAVQVQLGDQITLEQSGEGIPPAATVRYVEPAAFTEVSALGVEEQRVNVIADWSAPPTRLGDGYRVDTQIVVWSSDDVLKVPVSALFRCQQAWCVFVAQQGQAQQREVAIDQRNTLEAVVKSGLQSGDQVVLYPPDNLNDRQAIKDR